MHRSLSIAAPGWIVVFRAGLVGAGALGQAIDRDVD